MKMITLFTSQLAAVSSAGSHFARQYQTGSPHDWIPAGPNDFRGPCPMLNTLSNHGYFPRDGRNITKAAAIAGLTAGLNFNASLAALMWDQAIIANPTPNATFFTLAQLNVHNLLEHDASLSRTDAAFGSNHLFNESIFASSRAFWTADTVTAQMLADSKLHRQIQSRAFNPAYTFTATTEAFSLGEVAAPIIAFGDMERFTVPRDLLVYFFVHERLPVELGWERKERVVGLEDVLRVSRAIGEATSLVTGGGVGREDVHGGMV